MTVAEQHIQIRNFRGLNLFDAGINIPLEEASLCYNVWTSDKSGSVEMRPGTALSGLGSDLDFQGIVRGYWRFHRDNNNSFRILYVYNSTAAHDEVWVLESGTWVKRVDLVGARRTPFGTTLSLPDNLFFIANGSDLLLQFDGSVWESHTLGLIGGDLGTVAFTGAGLDDMTASGRHAHTSPDGYKVEIDAVDTGVQAAILVGKGLDDLTSGGTFSGTPTTGYHVKIQAIGTDGAPDTFRWSDDGGGTWSGDVAVTGASQALSDGVTVTFGAIDGHTVGDWWWFWAGVDTYRWSDDGGSTWDVSAVPIVGGKALLNKGIYIEFADDEGHTLADYWAFSGAVSRQLTPDTIIEVSGHILAWCAEDPKQVWYNVTAGSLATWTNLNFYQKASTGITGMADFEGIPVIYSHNAMFEIAGFPMDPSINRFASYGCFSQQCLFDMGEHLMWAGRGPDGFGVYEWAGGRPRRISKKIKTRYTEIDLANSSKCWATGYKGNYLFFYPSVTDGTNQCSRCLVWNIENQRWYEWRDVHFACGHWENAGADIGNFYLGPSRGTAGAVSYAGASLDDLAATGHLAAGSEYRITLDGNGTPDTFKWSNDNGATWEATGVAITGSWQTLEAGVKIKFSATTGHTITDVWDFDPEFHLRKLTEGTYANPFDVDGIELYWATGNIDCGDVTIPKEWTKFMPVFKMLTSGVSTAGYVQTIIDDVAGIQESIDETDEFDQVLPVRAKGIGVVDPAATLDDMTTGGTFTGAVARNFVIQIDAEGAPDTFKWSKNGGASWDATGVAIIAGSTILTEGVAVTFGATTGHTLADKWSFDTALEYPIGHFARYDFYYKGTKGIRFNLFKFWFRFFVELVNMGGDA